jgi:hypothetical protein
MPSIKYKSDIDLNGSAKILNLPASTSPNDAVRKSELDSAVATLNSTIASLTGAAIQTPTAIDCSTNPNYPVAVAGQSYYVTAAGKIGGAAGKTVNVGDLIICSAANSGGDEAAAGSNFFVLESNRDKATELLLGLVQLSSNAEVLAGTLTDKVVTPAGLQLKINTLQTSISSSLQFVTTVGNGTDNNFDIIHNIVRSGNRTIEVVDAATNDYVIVAMRRVDATTIRLEFTNPPTVNQFVVTVS